MMVRYVEGSRIWVACYFTSKKKDEFKRNQRWFSTEKEAMAFMRGADVDIRPKGDK